MIQTRDQDNLRIPPLRSGGLMLTYRCTNTCRHCLYRCSPRQPDEWLSLEMARRIFRALKQETYLRGIHIAGGEPTLKMDRLEEVIGLACEMAIPMDYVETNAAWCRDPQETRQVFSRLRKAGLPAVLVSVSMFHNEFVPFRNTRTCVEAAQEVFGPGNVLIYLPHMYAILNRLPDDGRHSLEEFCELTGMTESDPRIPALYGVIPGGRACTALRPCYTPLPAEAWKAECCQLDLLNTSHFHIDLYGNLFTGLCAGMAAAHVEDLHPEISEHSRPVFHRLCREGPYGLMEWAEKDYGFTQQKEGYISKCDLCLDVRTHLHGTGQFEELQPSAFYTG